MIPSANHLIKLILKVNYMYSDMIITENNIAIKYTYFRNKMDNFDSSRKNPALRYLFYENVGQEKWKDNEANTSNQTWYVLKTDVDVIWILCDPKVADQIGVFQIPQFLKNLSNIKV